MIKKDFDISQYSKVPPQDTKMERGVLGALLIEGAAYKKIADTLTAEMFYKPTHSIIFKAIENLAKENKPIDLFIVQDELKKMDKLKDVGGEYAVSELTSEICSGWNIEHHANVLLEKFMRRKAIENSIKSTEKYYDETFDVGDVLSTEKDEISKIQEFFVGKKGVSTMFNLVQKSMSLLSERMNDFIKGKQRGIDCGFADLTNLLNGWQPEKFMILAARPSQGKTALAIHFAKRAARQGKNVLFFSLEMGEVELSDRMIIGETAGDIADNYAAGNLNNDEFKAMHKAIRKIEDLPIFIDDNPKVKADDLINRMRLAKDKEQCDLVIIDYLQLVTPDKVYNRNREQEVSEISRRIKLTAKELQIPIIVLCQMSRDIEKSKKREPRLSDLRESGSLEQDADIVMFIHKEKDKSVDNFDENGNEIFYFDLIVSKNRGGKRGKIKVLRNESYTAFYDFNYKEQKAPF